ncbi:SagB family peptide dehydrogenase [Nonomuraea longicatena]|uniref:SagB/ThcOx family dehydrogenase n=1 Tax=Nonomuraea longicatena TaxID=83682 RepID=UPI0031D6F9B4
MRVGLRADAVVRTDAGVLTVANPFGLATARGLPPRVAAVLRRLPGTLTGMDDLVAGLLADGGTDQEVALLLLTLDRFNPILVHEIGPLRFVPIARDAVLHPPVLPADRPVRLSRFALVRRTGEELVLESPLSRHRVTLTGDALPLLGRDATAEEAAHLVAAGFTEEADSAVPTWDFHDLYFHSRSRAGRHDAPFGATFSGDLPPEPALKPVPAGPAIDLRRPPSEPGPPFTAVLESRRTVRRYGAPPTIDRLGELLHRSARVKHLSGPSPGVPYETSGRPYPGGGAVHSLELYLVVGRCTGLDQGAYYYDPAAHRLVTLPAAGADRRAMLDLACAATGGLVRPDVLITITSRFRRMSWKYSGMAYATVLKDVGGLYQTLYLVATAMGMAPCALGGGDADLAARTFGLDWASESSVGEFLIGEAGP